MYRQHALERIRPVDSRLMAAIEIAAVAGAIALAAMIKLPLPWTPIPLTLQTFPVLAAPFVIGRNRALAGIALYIVLGLAGAPLFTTQVAFGATFGYILSWVLAPWLVTAFDKPAYGITLSVITTYVLGTAWFCLVLPADPMTALWGAVLPFVPGDAIKAAGAWGVARVTTASNDTPGG